MKKKVGFIGAGFVGNAAIQTFKKYCKTEVYDIIKEKQTVSSLKELSNKSKVLLLSLPTPMNIEDGSCNLSIIEEVLQELNAANNGNIVVMRSSVKPGSTRKFSEKYTNLKFVFNPEFLREATAVEDFANQDRIILGGDAENTAAVEAVYKAAFPYVPVFHTSFETAEMAKFMVNCFLAAKVSFFNEMYQFCEKLGVNYEDAATLTLLDKRIGESHIKVPNGDPPKFGFGGSCFPCNVNILIALGKELGITPTILEATKNKNLEVRPEQDWLQLEGRTVIKLPLK